MLGLYTTTPWEPSTPIDGVLCISIPLRWFSIVHRFNARLLVCLGLWSWLDSNQWHLLCKRSALTNWATTPFICDRGRIRTLWNLEDCPTFPTTALDLSIYYHTLFYLSRVNFLVTGAGFEPSMDFSTWFTVRLLWATWILARSMKCKTVYWGKLCDPCIVLDGNKMMGVHLSVHYLLLFS